MLEMNDNNPFKEEEEGQTAAEGAAEQTEQKEVTEQNELEKLKSNFDELNNRYIRLAADFDNYRKRCSQEREGLLKYGAAETLTKLLTVLDTIERAEAAMENIEDSKAVKENYQVIFKQLYEVLQKCGLETIEAQGAEFDPNLHEAVMQTPGSEYPEHTIIAQMQTGYKLGDKVLRPALVNVATGEE